MSSEGERDAVIEAWVKQVVLLSIACLLLLVSTHRHFAAREEGALGPNAKPAVVVELVGAVKAPGIYCFRSAPGIEDVYYAGGGRKRITVERDESNGGVIPNGTRVRIVDRGKTAAAHVRPMTPDMRVILGIPLDVNAATVEDLMLVPGIGATLAAAIGSYRDSNGPFSRLDELQRVKGIGPRRFRSISKYFSVASGEQ